MKTHFQKLVLFILALVINYGAQAQIYPTNISSSKGIVNELSQRILFDTVKYDVPDVLIPKTKIPDDYLNPTPGRTYPKPYISKDSTLGLCALNGMCERAEYIWIDLCNATSQQWRRKTHQFFVRCYRNAKNKNKQDVCVSTTWNYVYVETHSCGGDSAVSKMNGENNSGNEGLYLSSINKVFPNPIQDDANFTIYLADNSDKVSIKIMDINGRVVDELYQENLPKGSVDITTNFEHLANGIYSAALYINGEYTTASKIIIAH